MANAVTRVTPTEKGKAKDAHRPSAISQKWKSKERADAQFLTDHDGPDPEMKHVVTSTGRLGHLTHYGYDCTSKSYVGESKCRALPSWVVTAWIQINQKSLERGNRSPVLFLHPSGENETTFLFEGKTRRMPPMHIITPDRHIELLNYEKQVKERDANASIG